MSSLPLDPIPQSAQNDTAADLTQAAMSARDAAMREVRVVNEKTGGEKGSKPQRFDLIPWAAVGEIAEVYAMGAEKYDDHNWRKGYDWGLSFAALHRHLALWAEGEDRDDESGLSHLAHAGWHVLTLLTFSREHPDLDDRFKAVSNATG